MKPRFVVVPPETRWDRIWKVRDLELSSNVGTFFTSAEAHALALKLEAQKPK